MAAFFKLAALTAAGAAALPDATLLGRAAAFARAEPGPLDAAAWASEAELLEDVMASGLAQVVRYELDESRVVAGSPGEGSYRPVVQMHGMGDFAADPMGMLPMKREISKELDGAYVTNVALGESPIADILNGFLLPLEASVDAFAAVVRADENLADGFNAIGYSQGNLILRGYVERYNDPPVFNHVSVHGPMLGVAGIPKCSMESAICREINNVLYGLAYKGVVQNHLTQANYLRDPLDLDAYRAGGLGLASWNCESSQFAANATYAANLASLDKLCLVHAENDTMVIPSTSEHFGFYQDGSVSDLWTMQEAPWYTEDWFGLKAMDAAGKIDFDSTEGDHLQFSTEQLLGWVDTYFKN